MNTRRGWLRLTMVGALVVNTLAVPEAEAAGRGSRGGHQVHSSASRQQHAPRVSAAQRPARMSTPRASNNASIAARGMNNGQANGNRAQGANNVNRAASFNGNGRTSSGLSPTNSYTYGVGQGARNYQAHGYGRGYRNRYSGGRRGYGNSQGNNRAVVSRLRSVHSTLARIDHDYQGHRVRAMHAVSMAMKQLSHRSMRNGSNNNNNNAMAMNAGMGQQRNRGNQGQNANRGQKMNQAQSDSSMSRALRTTQGIQMQLGQQGTSSTGHSRALGYVQTAVNEMGRALTIR